MQSTAPSIAEEMIGQVLGNIPERWLACGFKKASEINNPPCPSLRGPDARIGRASMVWTLGLSHARSHTKKKPGRSCETSPSLPQNRAQWFTTRMSAYLTGRL